MASRSARSPRNRKAIEDFDTDGGIGAFVAQHRLTIGGLTAFAVAFAYVTANAIWYQPHAHSSAFFATRPLSAPLPQGQSGQAGQDGSDVETVIRLERERMPDAAGGTVAVLPDNPPAPSISGQISGQVPGEGQQAQPRPVSGDAMVAEVQRILKGLNLYSGDVDGLTGPQTRAAIENYRKMVGLSASAEIDDQLLTQLGARSRASAGAPPLPQGSPGTDLIETSSAAPRGDSMIMRIQAGLKAFGNDRIEIDGVVGSRTKSAILEFQSLFGLPETGEPDQALYAKMRDIGLTD